MERKDFYKKVEKGIEEWYESQDGSKVVRESGDLPNGKKSRDSWVLRDTSGAYVDHDSFRNDLFSRNHIDIVK